MIFTKTYLEGSFFIDLEKRSDERGWFARSFCVEEFKQIGFDKNWVQINHSYTKQKHTIRGMHYQRYPYTEAKLVRCVRGAIFDVIVDIRKNSPTFLKAFSIELSALNNRMILIPEGMAHGFQTLSDDVELIYHHSAMYAPVSDAGLCYNDPALNIKWIAEPSVVSKKDESYALIDANFKGI